MIYCNHDCFNCKFPDCRANSGEPMTKWERSVLKGALGGWDFEINTEKVARMLRMGAHEPLIRAMLHLSRDEYSSIVTHIRKAARDCNHKAAHTKIA